MTRIEQEPVEGEGSHKWDPGSKSYTHPAFGQLRASRQQGGNLALYGSDFRHDTTIAISISRSILNRDLSRDWHHAGEELIEVVLSEAQWATFVSSLNCGTGVPCTIRHVDRESMPDIPLRNERDVVSEELDARVKRVTEHLNAAIADVEANLVGLSKAKRDAIMARIIKAQREVSDSMPFAAKSFSEHVEKTVEKAKIEVEAYMHGHIVRAGLAALGAQPPISIGENSPRQIKLEP